MKHSEFWQGQTGLDNIKPKRIGSKWESYDTTTLINKLVGDDSVVDVGCGTGRLSRAFKPEQYVGVDVNETAIELSRKENPEYRFEILKEYSKIPKQDVMLLHSVALHIPDEEITNLFTQAEKRIVLAETMGTRNKPRDNKVELAFHYARTANEYAALLQNWKLVNTFTKRDSNSGKVFTYMEFEK